MAGATTFNTTGDSLVDGVLIGLKWNTTALTFGFPTLASQYPSNYSSEITNGFAAVNAQQQSVARAVFAQYQAVSGLTFTEATATPGSADLRIAVSETAASTAYAYMPGGSAPGQGGDVWFSRTNSFSPNIYDTPVRANYAYATFLHEIGHALGLKHGHETDSLGSGYATFNALPTQYDSMEYSVMTYRSYTSAPLNGYTNESWGYAQTIMMADIAGIQEMYGANFNTNSGNTIYTFSSTTGQMFVNGVSQEAPGGNRVFLTIWDGGGSDTYDFSNYTGNQTIDLSPGSYSLMSTTQQAYLGGGNYAHGNVYNALQYHGDIRSLIENAIGGSGNDTITGNAADNTLTGNAGHDTLNGGTGNDVLDGGLGNDTINGGANTDTASYVSAGGGVTVSIAITIAQNTINAGADTLSGIENLLGSAYNDTLTGDAADNGLSGGAGNDILTGGLGNDTLTGGLNADKFFYSAGADVITDFSAAQADKIDLTALTGITSLAQLLAVGVQNGAHTVFTFSSGNTLTLQNVTMSSLLAADFVLAAGSGSSNIDGNASDNVLNGTSGNDVINGLAGNDTLAGGLGNDTLDGGSDNDTASYAGAGSGVTVSLALTGAQNTIGDGWDTLVSIENLIGSLLADNLTGGTGNNVLTGGAGNDSLNGGAGTNTMIGGTGDDLYHVFGVNDVLTENAGEGNDTVYAYASFSLAAGSEVENIYVLTTSGLTITGSNSAQSIVGNSGNDVLNGGGGGDILNGGAGTNTLIGGSGGDIYHVQGTNDTVTELAGGGFDIVLATANLTLAANSEIEYIAVNTTAGLTITGSDTSQTIVGGAGNDMLNGAGGEDMLISGGGTNTLNGGTGNDIY